MILRTKADMLAAFSSGCDILKLWESSEVIGAILNSIEREDGSNTSYILTFSNKQRWFVRFNWSDTTESIRVAHKLS